MTCPFSDHFALEFSVSGPGLWKLNVSILEEREYFDVISDFWSRWKYRKAVYSSLGKWWEDGKSKIKGHLLLLPAVPPSLSVSSRPDPSRRTPKGSC